MTKNELTKIADEIKALSPPNRLRLAADLMDQRKGEIAYTIAKGVVEELGAAIAVRQLDAMARRTG